MHLSCEFLHLSLGYSVTAVKADSRAIHQPESCVVTKTPASAPIHFFLLLFFKKGYAMKRLQSYMRTKMRGKK